MRILLVEDTERVVDVVTAALRASGHAISVSKTCAAALRELANAHFDMAIIDVGLPDGSGLDVCRAARGRGCEFPVLLLTARNDVKDRVAGLDAGADDYLGKPFSIAELTARVRALGRRGARWTESVRSFGDGTPLVIDRERRTVSLAGKRVALTPREFEIVALLAWRDGRVVSRDDLLEIVWGDTSASASASLEVLVTRIRRKVGTTDTNEVIRTVRQMGYAWALAPSKKS